MIIALIIVTLGVGYSCIQTYKTKKRMTDLEKELINLVQKQNALIDELRANQLQVHQDKELIVVTYKDQIIYKAKPIE